jgi:putative transposase
VGEIANDLKDIFYSVAKERDFEIKALKIMPDHVHLFISLKSRIPSLWTRSYFCCSVGNISDEAVKRYIEEQKNA